MCDTADGPGGSAGDGGKEQSAATTGQWVHAELSGEHRRIGSRFASLRRHTAGG
jgi:hypothetical protein